MPTELPQIARWSVLAVAVDRATPGGKNSYSAAGAGTDEHQRHVARESRAVLVRYRAYPDLRGQLLQTACPLQPPGDRAALARAQPPSASRPLLAYPRKEVVSGPPADLA